MRILPPQVWDPVCLVAKRHRQHVRKSLAITGAVLMGLDALGIFGITTALFAEHVLRQMGITGAALSGSSVFLE